MATDVSGDLSRLLIAIPALNEAETVGDVVRDVRNWCHDRAVVLVVDDGSDDDTAAIAAAAGAQVLQMPFNVGVGAAMRAAYLYATRSGLDRVVQVDADGQHDVSYIDALLEPLQRFDVVVGSRFSGIGEYRLSRPRRLAILLLSRLVSLLLRVRLDDVTSGFRAAGPRALSLFSRHYPSQYLGDTVESLVMAHRAGLTITQVGVEMRSRQRGTPSQGTIRSTTHLARALLVLGLSLVRSYPSAAGGSADRPDQL